MNKNKSAANPIDKIKSEGILWHVKLYVSKIWGLAKRSAHKSRSIALYLRRQIEPYGRVATSIGAIGSIIILALPKISINSSVNLDPQDPFATSFAVKNEGSIPLIVTSFGCRPVADGNVGFTDLEFQQYGKTINLWPGQTITRSCAVSAPNALSLVEVDVFIEYKTIYMLSGRRTVYFSGRKGRYGYFLVPDVK